MPYKPKPTPCYLDRFEKYKVIDNRQVYKGEQFYYTWDELHGEIEVFNKRGLHYGTLDAVTGKRIKDGIKGRRLHVR